MVEVITEPGAVLVPRLFVLVSCPDKVMSPEVVVPDEIVETPGKTDAEEPLDGWYGWQGSEASIVE